MRYLKKHQGPLHDFEWDHYLRALWRKMGNTDPITEKHKTCYVLRNPFYHITAASVALPIGGLAVVSWTASLYALTSLSVAIVILLEFAFWMAFSGEFEDSDKRFLVEMVRLAKAMGYSVPELASFSEKALQSLAHASLFGDAVEHLQVERKFLPGTPEREETRATFSEHFDLFKKWKLISEDETWTPFFRQAQEELPSR